MGRRKRRNKQVRMASITCLRTVIERVEEAASIAAAASALIEAGDDERAFGAALDLETLLHDATQALGAVSMLRRSMRDP